MLSVVTQLLSAALYVPALLGIVCAHTSARARWGAGLLLLGATGSAMDAIFHLLAYAMTAPNLERAPLLQVMAFMQGPGLRLVAPFIISFFAGSVCLSVALMKDRVVSKNECVHLPAGSWDCLRGKVGGFGRDCLEQIGWLDGACGDRMEPRARAHCGRCIMQSA